MSQICRVCNHSERLQIDRELVKGRSKLSIARNYGLSDQGVAYHSNNHLSHQLVTAYERKQALEDMNLLSEIEDLLARTKNILTIAEDKKRYRLALNAIKEARGTYELLAKMAVSLHQARLAELELERTKSGKSDGEEQQQFIQLVYAKLNHSEVELFLRLLDKIHGETVEMIVPGLPIPPPIGSSDSLPPLKRIPSYDDEKDDYRDFDFDDEDNESEPDRNSTTMKRTKEPAGMKKLKDLVSEDFTVRLQP